MLTGKADGKLLLQSVLKEHRIPQACIQKSIEVIDSLGLLADLTEGFPLKRGMTNQTFLFTAKGEKYLLRLSGEGTEHIINREHEVAVYEALKGQGITETVLYISAETGIKVSCYISDMHPCDARSKEDVRKCLGLLRQFHGKKLKVSHVFDIYEKISLYEKQCGRAYTRFPDYQQMRQEVLSLRSLIRDMETYSCLCHVDAVSDNFLVGNERTYLIDWEYASMCDPYIDVAMFCIYAEYEKPMTDWVIREYMDQKDTPEARMLVYAYMCVAAFLWVLWCRIKRDGGVDYADYEESQYRLAKEYCQYAKELHRRSTKNVF